MEHFELETKLEQSVDDWTVDWENVWNIMENETLSEISKAFLEIGANFEPISFWNIVENGL